MTEKWPQKFPADRLFFASICKQIGSLLESGVQAIFFVVWALPTPQKILPLGDYRSFIPAEKIHER
jgi:hypothetical protein